MTYIYLVENCFEDPNKIYIGKTKNSRKSTHKKRFGQQIKYTVIDEVNSLKYEDWEPLETFWIHQFKQWGFEIMNIRKKGGSGPEFQTEEVCNKISKSLTGRYYKKEWKEAASKPKPDGFGDKIKQNDKRGNKIQSSNQKHYLSGSKRNEKISLSLTGKKHSKTSPRLKPKGFGDKISNNEKRSKKISEKNSKSISQMKDNKVVNIYNSLTQASKITGISIGAISACLKGKSNNSGGYKWIYN
jgi:hypothetical protein